jgi:hypothetical protein
MPEISGVKGMANIVIIVSAQKSAMLTGALFLLHCLAMFRAILAPAALNVGGAGLKSTFAPATYTISHAWHYSPPARWRWLLS